MFRHAPVAEAEWAVPRVSVTDYPRFGWRGLLIDPARHFIPKRDMMRFINAMAMHKFNRLQVHFTDGQGWRIEIKKYPLLTKVASQMHNSLSRKRDLAKIYGGFYTQDSHSTSRFLRRALRNAEVVADIDLADSCRTAVTDAAGEVLVGGIPIAADEDLLAGVGLDRLGQHPL